MYIGDIPGTGILATSSGQDADPTSYLLTMSDGTEYTFVGDWGSNTADLQSVREPAGNTLQISEDGITHSTGANISFERDEAGRIASTSKET